MPGGADGQELGQSLNHSQDRNLEVFHHVWKKSPEQHAGAGKPIDQAECAVSRKKVPFVGGAGTYEGLRCEGPLTHLYYFTLLDRLQDLISNNFSR